MTEHSAVTAMIAAISAALASALGWFGGRRGRRLATDGLALGNEAGALDLYERVLSALAGCEEREAKTLRMLAEQRMKVERLEAEVFHLEAKVERLQGQLAAISRAANGET